MALTDIWFILIATLWTGYFVLEGFDFGVGMLLPILGRAEPRRAEPRRAALLATIGPVWDATLFSGFYLPLLLILVALIGRGVAIEYRGKRPDPAWRRRCDRAITAGSALPAVLWGVAFANLLRGLPLTAGHDY